MSTDKNYGEEVLDVGAILKKLSGQDLPKKPVDKHRGTGFQFLSRYRKKK